MRHTGHKPVTVSLEIRNVSRNSRHVHHVRHSVIEERIVIVGENSENNIKYILNIRVVLNIAYFINNLNMNR